MSSSGLKCIVPPGYLSYLDASLIILIMLLCLSQNTLILLVIFKLPSFQTPSNAFIGCLALADLYVSFVPLPMTFLLYVCSWVPKDKMYAILDVMASTVSITSLTAIACDRYYAIVHPYKHERNMTMSLAILFSTFVWIYGIICALLRLVIPVLQYTLFIVMAAYVVPIIIMFWSNVQIAIIAKRHAHRIFQFQEKTTKERGVTFHKSKFQNVTFKSSVNATCATMTSSIDMQSPFDVTTICVRKNKVINMRVLKNSINDDFPSDVSCGHVTTYNDVGVIPEENEGNNGMQCSSAFKANETPKQYNSFHEDDVKFHRSVTFSECHNSLKKNLQKRSLSCGPEAFASANVSKETFKRFVDSNLLNRRQTSFIRRETTKVIAQARKLRQELKASMTLAIIMGVFLILWTPFIGVNIGFYLGTFDTTSISNLIMLKYFKILHHFNSAVNPACYVLLNSRWRKAVKKILQNIYKHVRSKKKVHPRPVHPLELKTT